jgi:hypothetical protein
VKNGTLGAKPLLSKTVKCIKNHILNTYTSTKLCPKNTSFDLKSITDLSPK